MNFELVLFLLSGLVSMSAALSTSAVSKMKTKDQPNFLHNSTALACTIVAGNIAVLVLLFSMAFAFKALHWWIPVSCLFITFPLLHVLVFERLFGHVINLFIMLPLSFVSAVFLYINW